MNGRQVTATDVARKAGVSRATVSYVMNGLSKYTVADGTRKRVLAAAEELGYTPSVPARALRGKRDLVLCVMPNWPIGLSTSELLHALAENLRAKGFTFLIRLADSDSSVEHLWRSLAPAAVLSFLEVDPETVATARAEGISVTMAMFDRKTEVRDHVDIPEQSTGRLQVEHLVSRGRSRLALGLPGDPRLEAFVNPRSQGVREACAARGLPAPQEAIVDLTPEDAANALEHLLEMDPLIDGICCYNDDVAVAVLAGARRLGIRVPGRIAVIGVDDEPIAGLSDPALTTIRVDVAANAQRFTDAIIAGILGHNVEPLPEDWNSVSLVVREST